jgi:hypothetical protein
LNRKIVPIAQNLFSIEISSLMNLFKFESTKESNKFQNEIPTLRQIMIGEVTIQDPPILIRLSNEKELRDIKNFINNNNNNNNLKSINEKYQNLEKENNDLKEEIKICNFKLECSNEKIKELEEKIKSLGK